ncbi:MAG TPA: DNA topoisomerase 4 subunit A, partial [Chitinophagales bacterium]|nr:DNA topoisomerase 4 subunit A [Chitinophagales bacterium]
IIQVNIEEQMKTAYIDYSMSVIVSRALPDVRDGLKPVQRRVLYGMYELGVGAGKPYKKSARIVGEVLGKYHPHGDGSVYDAMVRLAQQWSLRYPLVDGQGNFGSVDGDSPAAMRYTEARFSRIAEEFTEDLEKETVDTRLNFDDSLTEPVVMPTQIPSLLVNGASGIAVGMATNMLPHNLAEVVDGVIAYVDDNQISIADLMKHIKAPDFPTGGIIYGTSGVQRAFLTGRGSIIVRGRTEIEQIGNREQIIVTEIPYQVNKALLIQKTADLVNDKTIEGISDIRDESDRRGMRIVYELKRDANPNVVLNQLFKHTSLQSSFGVNNVCLVNGRPRILNLKELIKYFVEFRHEVVVRRTQFELRKAEERAHILEGLLIALDNLDAVIQLIRKAATPDDARDGLITQFGLSEIQAKAILEMRLQRLTGLERDKIRNEYEELQKHISHLKEVLANESLRMDIIKNELLEIKRKYADKRRTEIEYAETGDIHFEELIERVPRAKPRRAWLVRRSLARRRFY